MEETLGGRSRMPSRCCSRPKSARLTKGRDGHITSPSLPRSLRVKYAGPWGEERQARRLKPARHTAPRTCRLRAAFTRCFERVPSRRDDDQPPRWPACPRKENSCILPFRRVCERRLSFSPLLLSEPPNFSASGVCFSACLQRGLLFSAAL